MDYTNFGWLLTAWLLGFPLIVAIIEKIRTPKSTSSNYDAGKHEIRVNESAMTNERENVSRSAPTLTTRIHQQSKSNQLHA